MKANKGNAKEIYTMRKKFKLIYTILVIFAGTLNLIRWMSVFSNVLVINSEINSHISNYALSLLFYLAVGIQWIQSGEKFSYVIFLGIFLIIANIVCETLLDMVNTTDIVGAVYGVVGVFTSFVFLFVTKKYGLIPNDDIF